VVGKDSCVLKCSAGGGRKENRFDQGCLYFATPWGGESGGRGRRGSVVRKVQAKSWRGNEEKKKKKKGYNREKGGEKKASSSSLRNHKGDGTRKWTAAGRDAQGGGVRGAERGGSETGSGGISLAAQWQWEIVRKRFVVGGSMDRSRWKDQKKSEKGKISRGGVIDEKE